MNKLKGGKGDKLSPKNVSKEELKKGKKVEGEHTGDPELATEITLDHLAEKPDYYTRLQKAGLADELEEDTYMKITEDILQEFLQDILEAKVRPEDVEDQLGSYPSPEDLWLGKANHAFDKQPSAHTVEPQYRGTKSEILDRARNDFNSKMWELAGRFGYQDPQRFMQDPHNAEHIGAVAQDIRRKHRVKKF